MSAPSQMPSPEELKKRREPKYNIDIATVTPQCADRARSWGHELIKKHEHKLNNKWKHRQIVTSGTVEPEAIDIRAVYPFADLHWLIYKENTLWVLLLMSKKTVLTVWKFAKI